MLLPLGVVAWIGVRMGYALPNTDETVKFNRVVRNL